jgi:hypothetical protein
MTAAPRLDRRRLEQDAAGSDLRATVAAFLLAIPDAARVRELMKHKDAATRTTACLLARDVGGREFAPDFARLARDDADERVRHQALLVLKCLGCESDGSEMKQWGTIRNPAEGNADPETHFGRIKCAVAGDPEWLAYARTAATFEVPGVRQRHFMYLSGGRFPDAFLRLQRAVLYVGPQGRPWKEILVELAKKSELTLEVADEILPTGPARWVLPAAGGAEALELLTWDERNPLRARIDGDKLVIERDVR